MATRGGAGRRAREASNIGITRRHPEKKSKDFGAAAKSKTEE